LPLELAAIFDLSNKTNMLTKNGTNFEIDNEQDCVTMEAENGTVMLGLVFGEFGPEQDSMALHTHCNSPEGYVVVTNQQMMDLFEVFCYNIDNSSNLMRLDIKRFGTIEPAGK